MQQRIMSETIMSLRTGAHKWQMKIERHRHYDFDLHAKGRTPECVAQ
jgi:hypothetical protein